MRLSRPLFPFRFTFRFFLALAAGLCIGASLGAAHALHRLWLQVPEVGHLADYEPMLPLRIHARDGRLLAEYGEERRQFVPIGRIPPTVRNALLAIEDARFYEHGAVDYAGIARAALGNLVAGEHAQGASTITMQVARVFFLSREKTYRRKLMEILLAYKLEAAYSKDKILELYMNQIYLGERAYGFAAAASVYFDKTLDQLSVAEAAMLAGLPKAPSAYNPVVNRERATVRQQHILQRMRALGHLDEAAYQQARAEPLTLRPRPPSSDPATAYAVEQVRKMMVARFGDEAYSRGLDVTTTLDTTAQQAATRALRAGLQKARRPQLEGALVSIDARSGDILALVGGFDFAANQFDHAVQAVRQPGSTFKPFVFSAALEKGYFPGTRIDDTQRLVTPAARGRKAWRPRNYGHQYEGFITARRALARSKNVVAVNLMDAAGPGYVQQFATRFGFAAELNPPILPLALGAGAVTPLQLTEAYAVFANGGERVESRLVLQVSERGGEVLYDAPALSPRAQVISPRNAYVMDSLLRDVVRQGTARRAQALGREDAAGKTGTSNDARDVWFAGYSSGIASVVWMGFDQSRSLGNATGGSLALPVWTDYMKTAVAGRPEAQRELPADLVMMDGDYVYREYLDGPCVVEPLAFIERPFECLGEVQGAGEAAAAVS